MDSRIPSTTDLLVFRFLEGDDAAYAEFVRRQYRQIVVRASQKGWSPSEVHMAASEAIEKVHAYVARHRSRLYGKLMKKLLDNPALTPCEWLGSLIVLVTKQRYRKLAKAEAALQQRQVPINEETVGPAPSLDFEEVPAPLAEAIRKRVELDPRIGAILRLVVQGECVSDAIEEVAQQTGTNKGSLNTKWHRYRNAIVQELTEQGVMRESLLFG